jgi:hypothetical protein
MIHTQAFYDEIREKKAAQKKEYRDNREEERAAYRKIFSGVNGVPVSQKPDLFKGVW